jgi:predicted cupin superfamily sugar epimerase
MEFQYTMNNTANFFIEKLKLAPHPEGGYFNEIYRSSENIEKSGLPERYDGKRCFSTSIYHLLDGKQVSKFHRLKSDEIWHFYSGSALTVHLIDPDGNYTTIRLGSNVVEGEVFQAIVPAGSWFGAIIDDQNAYTLIGCTVAPGFDFSDFEMADRNSLLNSFPQYKEIIEKLT